MDYFLTSFNLSYWQENFIVRVKNLTCNILKRITVNEYIQMKIFIEDNSPNLFRRCRVT